MTLNSNSGKVSIGPGADQNMKREIVHGVNHPSIPQSRRLGWGFIFFIVIIIVLGSIAAIEEYKYYNPQNLSLFCRRNMPEFNGTGKKTDLCYIEPEWSVYCKLRSQVDCPDYPKLIRERYSMPDFNFSLIKS